jgi:NADH-quinone oxidoreductase subunit C
VLRDRSDLGFSYPADLCGEDTGDGIRLWYRLWAPGPNVTALVEVLLDRASPEVASVADVWPGFDWFERECFDMFGVRFVGHPRAATPSHMRILLPEDWVGFPFRKDYVPDFGGDPLRGPQETN